MQCPNCNEIIQTGISNCPHCGHTLTVTVLSRQERDGFNGITIEGESADNRSGQYKHYEASGSPRIKRINLSFGSSGWTGNLIAAAVLAVLLFFFLPVLMFILLIVGAAFVGIWLLRMLMRK